MQNSTTNKLDVNHTAHHNNSLSANYTGNNASGSPQPNTTRQCSNMYVA